MGSSPISFHVIDIDFVLKDEAELTHWLTKVSQSESHFIGRLSYHFCSDEHLLEMNRTHLDHDYYTDIITFDESRPPVLAGDVFISLDRVKDNALQLGTDWTIELYRVMVHGLLHLMGYKDKSDSEQEVMRSKESEALKLLH